MRILPATLSSGLLCLYCAAAAVAQRSAGPVWSDLQAKNPPGIELSLRLTEPHSYLQGELIRAQIGFPGRSFAPAQQPPRERWQFAGFLLDPAGDCGSLVSPCHESMTLGFDKTDPTHRLGETSAPLAVSLNNYLPALRPARYRTAALVRKLVLTNRGPMSTTYGYADPPQYAVSNTVEIEVIAATQAWLNRAIASSAANLNGPQPNTHDAYEQRRVAAEQLRFLDVPAAWSASLALLPAEENILLRGLAATREPARVCEVMQEGVPAPSQAVSSYYLSAMAQTCARANLPAAPPYTRPRPGEKPPEPSAEQQQYWRRYREYDQGVIEKANASLAASVARKQGEAKAIAFQTLMERVRQVRANEPRQPWPAWLPVVKAEFTKSYTKIDGWRQRQLLGLYASTLRSPDMVPLLESVLDAWKPGDWYEASREAVQNLYAIDPARAQARIVAELAKARTWLDSPQLELLSASAARITDDALIEALAAAQRAGGWNVQLRMTALAKYASPKALPRIKAIYDSQQDSCQPELMAYFVRVDPAYADRVFHSHPWDMHAAPPHCTERYFERTPQIALGPVLERYMTAYLMHGDVRLKQTAAQSLGRFGSPAAVGPLWDAFRYFHDYWKGKQAELAQNGEGVFLEVELRNAIARGRHWLATETDLRTIESLCISERCLYETQQDLRAWQRPLRIEVSSQAGGIRGQVAQYYGIESMQALEEKVAQFPKGTQFVLAANDDGADGTAVRIRKIAAAHGLTVVSH
ncbi:MAG: hypothetical protein ABSH05_27700 [Bryobacteraceae bacterium]|jgi:hypothetical protein